MSLKNRSQFSSTLDNELKNKLKELSGETQVPISKLLDQAVELLLKQKGASRDTNRKIGE
ncbi:Ribbon-helix-helix domain protein [compost metagenome]